MPYPAVTEEPVDGRVHAMRDSTPATVCGLEAADCYVVTGDFLTVPVDRRCSACEQSIGECTA